MSLAAAEGLLRKKYIYWDNNVYTNRWKLLPIIRLNNFEDENGKEWIRIEYLTHLSCKEAVKSKRIDSAVSAEEIVTMIDKDMCSDEWFYDPEYFINPDMTFLIMPNQTLHLRESDSDVARLFSVTADEGEVMYTLPNSGGKIITTKTRFNLSVPAGTLDLWKWYELRVGHDAAKEAPELNIGKSGRHSLVLTGTLDGRPIGLSAYNPAADSKTRALYTMEFMPDRKGFRFMVKSRKVERVWFKVAWLRTSKAGALISEQALNQWIR